MTIAIHHITTITAIPSPFEDATYLTLEFEHSTYEDRQTYLILYFEKPEPGKLRALCQLINSVLQPEPDHSELNWDIPF